MKLNPAKRVGGPGGIAGFTLVELMVASAIALMVLAAGYSFLSFALKAMAGASAQTVLNNKGGTAIEFIEARARFATYMATSTSGNTLTLGFDDNYNVDSDGNGKTYDDRDHYEQFKFQGTNSTNVLACAGNQLIYIPNTNSATSRVLISGGVRNLPGFKIFSTTNQVITVIRFGIADPNLNNDHYQAIDLQGSAVSLNRPWTNNIITIAP
jgi:prepilin-type N-terminal cleavage/methylation domain-containing protein